MISRLYIEASFKNGKTFLHSSFTTPPFKIADITEDRSGKELRLMIMSSSPGVLDGDEYSMELNLEENAILHLESQSYQRLFQMKHGASQFFDIRMKKKSSLVYLPHPVVPHSSSRFKSINKILIEDGCRLIWGEVLTSGRKLCGESFQFSKYQSITEIYKKEKLLVKENILIQPALVDPFSIGQLEGFSHQASLIFIDEHMDIKTSIDFLRNDLKEEKTVVFGITELPVNGLIIRMLGYKAEQLFELVKKYACYLELNSEKMNNPAPILNAI